MAAAISQARDAAPLSGGHPKRALGRAHGHALQAARALGRADGDQLVHRKQRRAGFGALGAIDADLRRAPDARRTEASHQPQQRAVGAQVAAPEVLDEDREQHENAQDDRRGHAQVAEEVEHLHVGDHAVGAVRERPGWPGRSWIPPRKGTTPAGCTSGSSKRCRPSGGDGDSCGMSDGRCATAIPRPYRPGRANCKTTCAGRRRSPGTKPAGTHRPGAARAGRR